MRRFLISIIGAFVVFSAGATGENVSTTKSYIDSALTQKQDTIERTTGASQALTNTGTAGEYGTKEIYDSNGEYATQQDALIDAQTMNTAVQNAINAEFVCISWVDDDPTKDCLLMEIRGTTGHSSSKNLFDLNAVKAVYANSGSGVTPVFSRTPNGLTITAPGEIPSGRFYAIWFTFEKVNKFRGKTLTFSAQTSCENGGLPDFFFGTSNDDGTVREKYANSRITIPDQPDESMPNLAIGLYATARGAGTNPSCTYSNIQVEEGETATSYEPYSNLYLPAGN